jgi:hypothetical protein
MAPCWLASRDIPRITDSVNPCNREAVAGIVNSHSHSTGMARRAKRGGLEKGSPPLDRGVHQKPEFLEISVLEPLLNLIQRGTRNGTARASTSTIPGQFLVLKGPQHEGMPPPTSGGASQSLIGSFRKEVNPFAGWRIPLRSAESCPSPFRSRPLVPSGKTTTAFPAFPTRMTALSALLSAHWRAPTSVTPHQLERPLQIFCGKPCKDLECTLE